MVEKKKIKQEKVASKMQDKEIVVGTRGRMFEGTVIKKFPLRIVIEYTRTVYVPKYERFYKKKSRIHARLLGDIDVSLGDLVKVQECRPLSKIIHHVLVVKIKSVQEKK